MGKACGHIKFHTDEIEEATFFMHDSHDACPILFFYNPDYTYFHYSGIIKIFPNAGLCVVHKCRIVFPIVTHNCRQL